MSAVSALLLVLSFGGAALLVEFVGLALNLLPLLGDFVCLVFQCDALLLLGLGFSVGTGIAHTAAARMFDRFPLGLDLLGLSAERYLLRFQLFGLLVQLFLLCFQFLVARFEGLASALLLRPFVILGGVLLDLLILFLMLMWVDGDLVGSRQRAAAQGNRQQSCQEEAMRFPRRDAFSTT